MPDEHAEAPRREGDPCRPSVGDQSGRYADDPEFQTNCRPHIPRPAEDEEA